MLQDIVPHLWHEPILRLLTTAPTRFRDIRTQLNSKHGNKAPLDGQISKSLRSLGELGYVQKSNSKHSPWFLTELGDEAVSILDRAYRTVDTDVAPLSRVDKVETSLSSGQWRIGVDRQVDLGIDTTRAHPARRYNYLLGGKDNFQPDRDSGDELARLNPAIKIAAQENRAFLQRAVGFLAKQGIRQFIDIGTGLPTADNTHEVAQRIAPESRIVYVDNDPLVLVHARALLTSTPEGRTAYLDADLREPEKILNDPVLRDSLDLTQPTGLVLVSILPFVPGNDVAGPIVRTLLDAVPSGSYLVLSHATFDTLDPEVAAKYWEMFHAGKSDIWPRTEAEVRDLFAGLELAEPGLVQVHQWRPRPDAIPRTSKEINNWGAVARKL